VDVRRFVLLAALALASCAPRAPARVTPAVQRLTEGARFTVVEFFSVSCGCQKGHDASLIAMMGEYGPRGVRFVVLDAEAGRTQSEDDDETRRRAYPIAIRRDDRGELARALGAEFATYAVILDGDGRVRYAGGMDSSHTEPGPGTRPWLRDALDALLAGREPPVREERALGCVLHLP
jgi:hypothetical protein